jgi:hypothetical protein
MTVRTSPHHLNAPLFAADSISKDFIEIVLGCDINEFFLKYVFFALFRLKGMFAVLIVGLVKSPLQA